MLTGETPPSVEFLCRKKITFQGIHPLERELQGEESRLPRFIQKAEEVKVGASCNNKNSTVLNIISTKVPKLPL